MLLYLCRRRILSREKRQFIGRCSGRRHQEGQDRDVLLFTAQVSQDLVNGVLVLNTAVRRIDDDPDRSTAAAAGLYVDTENAF